MAVTIGHIALNAFSFSPFPSLSRLTFFRIRFASTNRRILWEDNSERFFSSSSFFFFFLESTPILFSFFPTFLFLLRIALRWLLFTLHCFFSLSNLAHPFSSHTSTCFLSSLFHPLFRSPRAPSVLVDHALMRFYFLSPAQNTSHPTNSRDWRSLQLVELLQSTPSRHARWKCLVGFESSHCAVSCRRIVSYKFVHLFPAK